MLDADAVVVATRWMRRHVAGEGAEPNRIHLCDIREGLDPPTPPRTADDASRPRLLFVGRTAYGKGAQYAVEALNHLPEGATLRVVGDGWYLPELKTIAGRLAVADRVSFDGAVDEAAVTAAYDAADVLVVPSVWPEPAGLIVPEGRARGLPVVVFDRGGLPEWSTTYGIDGVHVAPEVSAAGLAEAVRDALADPAKPAALTDDATFEPIVDVLERARERFAAARR